MKEIFVFGAGASKGVAGIPLGPELVWDYYLNCTLLKPIRNGRPDLTEDNRLFSNYHRFLEGVGKIFPEFENEADKFINRKLSYLHPFTGNKKYYVDEILREAQEKSNVHLVELLRKLIFEHIVGTSLNKSQAYCDFLTHCLKSKNSGDVSLISFNFDYLLHEDFINDVYVDYLIQFDHIDHNRQKSYKATNPFLFIKLNGSLDWGICQKCNRISLFFHHLPRDFYEQKRCNMGCNGFTQPFIIIPHETYTNKIDILWESAKDFLRRAEKIMIIGYSFPEYDHKVIELFNAALNKSSEVYIIDYCENEEAKDFSLRSIRQKYKEMFPKMKNEFKISLDGFSKYVAGTAVFQH